MRAERRRTVLILLALSRRCFVGTRTAALVFAVVPFLASVTAAQTVDPRLPMTDGQVWSMVRQGDTLYIGGKFHTVGPASGGFVAIDPVTGDQKRNWPEVAGSVVAAVSDEQGGWFIGGSLNTVAGLARPYAAHVRADGTLDSWDPGFDGPITAFARDGTRLYVAGGFAHVGGQPRPGLAAIDPVSGAVLDWNPVAVGGVTRIATRRGVVYLQGRYSIPTPPSGAERGWQATAIDSASGQEVLWQNRYATGFGPSGFAVGASAVFVSSGLGPAAFDLATGAGLPWTPIVNGWTYALAVADTVLYLVGEFTIVDGQPRAHIAAVDARNGQVLSWNPGADDVPNSLVVQDSTLYITGAFTTIGGGSRRGIAALDARSGALRPWDPGATAPIPALLAASSSSLAASGIFGPGRAPACENLAAIDLRTNEVLDWNPRTTGLEPTVYTMAIGGGKLYVGGWFDTVGGASRPEVGSLDLATGLVTDWRPFPNTELSTVAVQDSSVYVGGAFTEVGGVPRRYVGAIHAGSGAPTSWAPDADNLVRGFFFRDTTVYCIGQFTTIGGQPRSGAAALSMRTGQPTAWNPSIGGEVDVMSIDSNRMWLGGRFQSVGGQPRSMLAQIDLATGAPATWVPDVVGLDVWTIAPAGSAVYVGGEFNSIDGTSRANAAAFDATTGALLPWNPNADGSVRALRADDEGVLAGGEFTSIAGRLRNGIVRLLPAETTSPNVTVLGPAGDEVLAIGTTRTLTWSASDAIAVQSVDVYLSRTGPTGPWTLLAAGAANTGAYDWKVAGPEADRSAWLQVVARNYAGLLGSAVGASAFSIASSLVAASPNGSLSPPLPNPVQSHALLKYALPRGGRVELSLVDIQGRVVRRIVDSDLPAGRHSSDVDASALRPGLYFARLRAPGVDLGQRVVVVR